MMADLHGRQLVQQDRAACGGRLGIPLERVQVIKLGGKKEPVDIELGEAMGGMQVTGFQVEAARRPG